MPFAIENGLMMDAPEDGTPYLVLTQEQYDEALAALLSGRRISIVGGVLSYVDPQTPEPEIENPLNKPLLRSKLRIGLLRKGYNTVTVNAAIAGITDDMVREETEIEWMDSPQFYRYSAVVINVTMALGMTQEAVDEMWLEALNS